MTVFLNKFALNRSGIVFPTTAYGTAPPTSFVTPMPAPMRVGAPVSETMAMKLSAVNRCIEVLSDSMSKLPTYLFDTISRKRVIDADIHRVLSVRPNEAMSPSVRKKMLEVNRLSTGNAYDWIVRNKRTGKIDELIPLPSSCVTPWRDTRGCMWYDVINPLSGEPFRLNGADVHHFKAFSHDGIKGISVLRRATQVIASATAAQEFSKSFYEGDAQPSGVLSVEGDLAGDITRTLPDGTSEIISKKDYIREEWGKYHSGPQNGHRVAVLDYGLKYQQIATSPLDAQYIETAGFAVEDIARFFGVPLYKLNAGKQSYSSNEQNAIEYVVGTLHPIVTHYEEEQTYKMLLPSALNRGLELRINMMAELKGDSTSRGSWYRVMREIGVMSTNDIRNLEDMPDTDGGDELYASLNYVPLSEWKALSLVRAEKGGSKK